MAGSIFVCYGCYPQTVDERTEGDDHQQRMIVEVFVICIPVNQFPPSRMKSTTPEEHASFAPFVGFYPEELRGGSCICYRFHPTYTSRGPVRSREYTMAEPQYGSYETIFVGDICKWSLWKFFFSGIQP